MMPLYLCMCFLLRQGAHQDPSLCAVADQILTPWCSAVATMKKGEAPTGKRLATELAEREKMERADPSIKERRLAEQMAKKARFFDPKSGDKPYLTSLLTNLSTPSHDAMDLDLSSNILTPGAACAPSDSCHADGGSSLPALPRAKQDRQEDMLYSHLHSGREVIVKWKERGGFLMCTCDQSTTSCKGGQRLNHCTSLISSVSRNVLEGSRPKARRNYATMNGGGAGAAPFGAANVARDNLYDDEVDRIANLREIPASDHGHRSLVVVNNGRWGADLMQFQGWTFQCRGVLFPLRAGAEWRKTFTVRSQHAKAVGKSSVTITFSIIQSSSAPERPTFRATDTSDVFSPTELEEDMGDECTLSDKLMLELVRGRKWVHDITLLEKGEPTETATDMLDKPIGGGKLGKKGQRRFAPATTRRCAQFVNTLPAQWGGIWMKIVGEKLEVFNGRISFVFKSQLCTVGGAYRLLSERHGDE